MNREWRLRIHDAGTTTPGDGTVAYTFDAEVESAPDTVGGQTVRVLDGRSESQPWQVKLVDASGAVTAVLGDASDRAQLGYRIADISKRDDGGSWVILATGRVSGITLDDVAGYVVSVQDERWIERSTTLWKGQGGTTSLWSLGFVGVSYGPHVSPRAFTDASGARQALFERDSHSGDVTVAWIRPAHEPEGGHSPVIALIEDDVNEDAEGVVTVSSASEGSYRTLRLQMEGEGSAREVVGFPPMFIDSFAFTGRDGELTQLAKIAIYDPSNNFATGYGALCFPTADPTDEVPFHVESRPGDLLEAIYDGDYSDGIAVRYDSTAMTALKNRLQADGIGALRWRIRATDKMSSWLEDNIYQPLGIVPLSAADGSVRPVKVYPTEGEISDPDNLYEFTESDCRLRGYHYQADEAISIVRATYPHEYRISRRNIHELAADVRAMDTIEENEYEHEEVHDTVADAGRVLELQLRGWHDRDRVESFLKLRSREVFEMFGDGPLYIDLWAGSAAAGVEAGDYVVVTHSAMPAPTGSRGDSRICFVLSRTSLANGYNFDLIEVGPSAQPLAVPTVSVAQAGAGATVTIGNVPTGAFWELRMHDGDSTNAPADTDTGWRTIATGDSATYTVSKIKHGVKVWFQARNRQEGRIPSDWSTADDITITALTAPSSLTVTTTGGAFIEATFTAGETDLPTEVHLNGTLLFTLPAGSDSLTVRGLTPSTAYNSPGLQVRHIDPQTGAVSAFDTATFTTASEAEEAPAYIAAALLVGVSG